MLLFAFPTKNSGGKDKKPPRVPKEEQLGGGEKKEGEELDAFPVRPFITAYRGAMIVVTCVAILAVDFRIFPRRFAKVETWGTSLMDLGVGSFVFSAGLVAAKPTLRARMVGKRPGLGRRLYRSVGHSVPLLVLGLVRLYSVKGLDYAEHVTEYGVHWNFFFTLGCLPLCMAVLEQGVGAGGVWYAGMAVALAVGYQVLLETTRLKGYILTAPRLDLLSKNREGMFSFVGYLAIFLAGQAIGNDVLPRRLNGSTGRYDAVGERRRLLVRLALWSVSWSIFLMLSMNYKLGFAISVSRRLANLPYVLWVAAFNCTQITAFCLIETLVFPTVHKATNNTTERKESEIATSRVLKSFNRNGLAVFLVANLLTGLVNLTMDTLHMSTVASMGVMIGYASILTAMVLALDAMNISVKI